MGYSTDFTGRFDLDKPLSKEHCEYLHLFSETRRMRRNPTIAETLDDQKRAAVGLPIGVEGGYFTGGGGLSGQAQDESITAYNMPPSGQPGLWCKWQPTEDAQGIEWNEMEKFYDYVQWIEYLIAHFLAPWGYVASGRVEWFGEDRDDLGAIVIENNVVTAKHRKIVDA